MEAIDQQIRRIQTKLQDLLKRHASALKEVEKQQLTIEKLREQQSLNEKKIKALEEQHQILKAAAGQMNEVDRKAFEQTINRYIREIDKCIALLSE